MPRPYHVRLWILIGIIIVVVIVSVAVFYIQRQEGKNIKIGVLTPLTGSMSEYGHNVKNGIEMAVEEINSKGGVNGKQIQLFYEDSKCDPKETVTGFNRLVDIQGINIILGTICSSETLAIAPVANEKRVLVISAGSTSPEITKAGDFIFRTFPSDDYEAGVAADVMLNKLNKSRVSILYLNNDYGVALKNSFKDKFTPLDGEVLNEESYLQDSKDFRTQLMKIKENDPEILYMISYPIDGGIAIKQARELGIDAIFFGSTGVKGNDFISTGGSATGGFLLASPAEASSEKSKSFARDYENKFGIKPGLTSDMAYDSVYILKEAFTGVENIEDVKNNLYKIKEFEGSSGKITIDSNGDRINIEYDLWVIKNGEFIPYER